jgi:glycosyl transferase family 25
MPEQVERRAYMTSQFEKLGLEYRYLDATRVEGWPDNYDRRARLRYYGFDLIRGEIGAYQSHRQAWKELLDSDARYICVLEDDAELHDDFVAGLEALCECADEWDVVRIFSVFEREGAVLKMLSSGHKLLDFFDQPRSMVGYLINREAATRLLECTETMIHPIDDAMDREWEHGLRLYGIRPYLVSEHKFPSSIGDRTRPKLTRAQKLSREMYRVGTNMKKNLVILKKRWRYRKYEKDMGSIS